jgi:hypothetical protein
MVRRSQDAARIQVATRSIAVVTRLRRGLRESRLFMTGASHNPGDAASSRSVKRRVEGGAPAPGSSRWGDAQPGPIADRHYA